MNKFVLSAAIVLSLFVSSCNSDSEDPNADLARDMAAIDAYLDASGVPDEKILADNVSGVRFVFDDYGQGIAPTPGQTVKYDVIGSVLSGGSPGAPFISRIESSKIDNVVPEGLNFGLRSILEGTTATVYVPARFGYGTAGNATLGIPADAVLKYDIVLTEITRTITQQNQFEADTLAIKNYLAANEIDNAIMHQSGLRYTVDIDGGATTTPNPYDAATFEYELRRIADPDNIIETGTLTENFIWGLVQGLRIGFQLMQVGDTYTFYLPSGMGYGPAAAGSIPANSNLIFKIKLTSVKG